jgi:hypothetical protein
VFFHEQDSLNLFESGFKSPDDLPHLFVGIGLSFAPRFWTGKLDVSDHDVDLPVFRAADYRVVYRNGVIIAVFGIFREAVRMDLVPVFDFPSHSRGFRSGHEVRRKRVAENFAQVVNLRIATKGLRVDHEMVAHLVKVELGSGSELLRQALEHVLEKLRE